jgi:hypothetical protein
VENLGIIDGGHKYSLPSLDGEHRQVLQFVKREGEGFPGNVGHYPGTTTQHVLRALIDRTKYVNGQISDPRNHKAVEMMREVILLFEQRAAERHGFLLGEVGPEIELIPTGHNGHLTQFWKLKEQE